MKIGIVLLYGLFSVENIDYKNYLDFVAQQTNNKNLDKLILCGGFTDPKNPKLSEAATAKNYLQTTLKNFSNFELEEGSITTNQNLESAKKKINNTDELTVICELSRLAKVIWISQHYLQNKKYDEIYENIFKFTYQRDLNKPFQNQNLTVIGHNFKNKTREQLIAQTFSTLLDVMALYDENFNDMDLKQRKKDFGLED